MLILASLCPCLLHLSRKWRILVPKHSHFCTFHLQEAVPLRTLFPFLDSYHEITSLFPGLFYKHYLSADELIKALRGKRKVICSQSPASSHLLPGCMEVSSVCRVIGLEASRSHGPELCHSLSKAVC